MTKINLFFIRLTLSFIWVGLTLKFGQLVLVWFNGIMLAGTATILSATGVGAAVLLAVMLTFYALQFIWREVD